MRRLSTGARAWRVAVTLVAAGLLLAGTIWGNDDHFPFGPFTMYAGAADPDQPTIDTRVEATDARGHTVRLTERNSGVRRAEIEGQLRRIESTPELLQTTVDAYERRNPHSPELIEVRIVVRWHETRDFRPTGSWTDEVVARWRP